MSRASHARLGLWPRICQRRSVRTDRGRIRDDRHRPIREGRGCPAHVSHRPAWSAGGIPSGTCHVACAVPMVRGVPGFSDRSPGGKETINGLATGGVRPTPSVPLCGEVGSTCRIRSLLQIRGRPVDPSKNPGDAVDQPLGSTGPRSHVTAENGPSPHLLPTAEDLDPPIEIVSVSSRSSPKVPMDGHEVEGELPQGPFRETSPPTRPPSC